MTAKLIGQLKDLADYWEPNDPAAAAIIRQAVAVLQPDDKFRLMLLDLLAIIHRDGGHKTQEIGIKLAWEQAMQLSSERIHKQPDEAAVERVAQALWREASGVDDPIPEVGVLCLYPTEMRDLARAALAALQQGDGR